MIVENKELTLQRATDMADRIIDLIEKDILTYKCEDDPAEFIYLTCHAIGNFLAKWSMVTDGYCKTYGIKGFDRKKIMEWINLITKENIKAYK